MAPIRISLISLFFTLILLACGGSEETKSSTDINSPRAELPVTILYTGTAEPEEKEMIINDKEAPEGMIAINGGNVRIGSEEGFDHERPLFWARVKPYFLDKSPVTVAQFREFVEATGYKTEAEEFGNAGVIHESTGKNWILKDGANWRYPMGPDFPAANDDHPVTQVSWRDAMAYAQWAGKRLPHEIEWEHAARNAENSRSIYPWGDSLSTSLGFKANVWNGIFPEFNRVEDGFSETSPVGQYGETPIGLTDMSGNVWEWCLNYKFDYRALIIDDFPGGMDQEKAQRGGSFLCEPTWCHGYRVSGRSSSTPETSLFHIGFRCLKEID
ncbi:formylglycine-generating enzyme family protein [Jiulongibacter sediminis]|uniref:formylglycine-generating enzyme family protein n=1 Tax=Jiulongibacter sediminis TaxID=1605367 RepID=UPI001E5FCAEB|nr:formylglycine-generating enzyme family protein [Jiulongibacter sediminis]